MDFNDTPEEAKFRAEARAFLEANVQPKSAEAERMIRKLKPIEFLKAAKEYQKRKAEAGFAGITWAKEQGGRGLPPIYSVIFNQEEAKFDAPSQPFSIGLGMCVPTVIAFSDEAIKDRYVAKALHQGRARR
jgi:alkylation response protein AidB-like acyl-CoA dehydrogenase